MICLEKQIGHYFLHFWLGCFYNGKDFEVAIVVWGYLNPNHPNHNYTITVPRKAKYFCDKLLTLDNKKTLYKWSCFKAKEPHYQTLVISYTHLSMRFEEIETCSWHVRRSLTTCLDRCLLWCIHQKYLLLLHPLTMTMWVLPKSTLLLEEETWWKTVLQTLHLYSVVHGSVFPKLIESSLIFRSKIPNFKKIDFYQQ